LSDYNEAQEMIIKRKLIILVFLISAILAAWPSIASGEVTLPLDKEGEVDASATFVMHNEALVAKFVEVIAARSKDDEALLPFVQSLNKVSLTITAQGQTAPSPQNERIKKWLNETLTELDDRSELDAATLRAASGFSFSSVFINSEIDQTLAENLLSLELASWYEPSGDQALWVGAFLIAPSTEYLLHTHDAHEVYFVVSGHLELQHGVDGNYFTVGPDQYSITPPHRPHALRTGDVPVLILYVWEGIADPENWWWERHDDNSWWRTPWRWENDGTWQKIGPPEQVTDEVMKAAHG